MQVTIEHKKELKTVNVSKMVHNGDGNTKTRKHGVEYLTGGLSMSPKTSGNTGVDMCTDSSPACVAGCLNETGLATIFDSIQIARKAKTAFFVANPIDAKSMIIRDIYRLNKKAKKEGKLLAVRLNMFTDVVWEREFPEVFKEFPDVQFYDYTKHSERFYKGYRLPENYHLTFSRSEKNARKVDNVLKRGGNVAAVFHNPGSFTGNRAGKQVLPEVWNGYSVIDGDISDMRFEDGENVIVGLKLKAANTKKRENIIKSGFSIGC